MSDAIKEYSRASTIDHAMVKGQQQLCLRDGYKCLYLIAPNWGFTPRAEA